MLVLFQHISSSRQLRRETAMTGTGYVQGGIVIAVRNEVGR